jgi:hypothetical protein
MSDQTSDSVRLGPALARLAGNMIEWVAVLAVVVIVERAITRPDFARTALMRAARTGELVAMRQASAWAHVADRCAHMYEHARQRV